MKGLAINVGANTTLPGTRGPIYPDGRFRYVPIPERHPTGVTVPTYAHLGLAAFVPADAVDRRVHLDPTFAGTHGAIDYTYGDEHWVKARRLAGLETGDVLWFYATLTSPEDPEVEWIPPTWGAYLIGHFQLAAPPVVNPAEDGLSATDAARFRHNAHLKRETFDAKVLVAGTAEDSRLYDRAVPLSSPGTGGTANATVTTHTTDSGQGPWWRRPLDIPDPPPVFDRMRTIHRQAPAD